MSAFHPPVPGHRHHRFKGPLILPRQPHSTLSQIAVPREIVLSLWRLAKQTSVPAWMDGAPPLPPLPPNGLCSVMQTLQFTHRWFRNIRGGRRELPLLPCPNMCYDPPFRLPSFPLRSPHSLDDVLYDHDGLQVAAGE